MLLKHKISIGALLLAALPVLISSVAIESIANDKSREALHNAA